jgi:hypothetical protein
VTDDAIALAERILQLLDQGEFNSTYKYAVLLGPHGRRRDGTVVVLKRPEVSNRLPDVRCENWWPARADRLVPSIDRHQAQA